MGGGHTNRRGESSLSYFSGWPGPAPSAASFRVVVFVLLPPVWKYVYNYREYRHASIYIHTPRYNYWIIGINFFLTLCFFFPIFFLFFSFPFKTQHIHYILLDLYYCFIVVPYSYILIIIVCMVGTCFVVVMFVLCCVFSSPFFLLRVGDMHR